MPFNAHTTASDALWAGLPVLTCCGESFASRVAASLLEAVRLPELIAPDHERYEQWAVELAFDSQRLERIKRQLAANRLSLAGERRAESGGSVSETGRSWGSFVPHLR